MRATLVADGRAESGGGPIIFHNERLADPLDEYVREIAKISKKRQKTEADHLEIARLEFLGGLYLDDDGPCVPAMMLLRCLQNGATRVKRGVDVPRGITPLKQTAYLEYDGVRAPDVMWKDGSFAIRKSVGVQRSRTMRTRPIFHEWRAELPIEVDLLIWDLDTLSECWRLAGLYAGLGEMRPYWGRFAGTITTDGEITETPKGKVTK